MDPQVGTPSHVSETTARMVDKVKIASSKINHILHYTSVRANLRRKFGMYSVKQSR